MIYYLRNKAVIAENQKILAIRKMQMLRAQMNPHFVFNTINGIQNFILRSEKYEAYEYLTKFSRSIRLIFEHTDKTFIKLSKVIELIREYIALEKIRFRDKIVYVESIDQNLLEKDPEIASMILQPLIENAILHGLSNKEDSGYIKLMVEDAEGYLKCIVEDNGIGREEATTIKNMNQKQHFSIASINTSERLSILKKSGYRKANLHINDLFDSEGNSLGTRVTVFIPVKK